MDRKCENYSLQYLIQFTVTELKNCVLEDYDKFVILNDILANFFCWFFDNVTTLLVGWFF